MLHFQDKLQPLTAPGKCCGISVSANTLHLPLSDHRQFQEHTGDSE